MRKRLVVCCDGTWNTPDQVESTNVCKLALAVKPDDADGVEQRIFYDKGVGTGRFEHFRGGSFGWGLSQNVQDAYMFLVQNFDPGDEIFLFGFSRGAYTARSVAGLVRNSGLLKRGFEGKLNAAYELYRDRDDDTHPRSVEAELFRRSFSHVVRIKFIGVWDTVGSLGIPVDFPGVHLVNDRWKFHDVKLSTFVDNAFQALAIDERRKPFTPTLWEQQPDATNQTLEQVWFSGVHSDVGGGYPETGLSDIALRWMMTKARDCGLVLAPPALKDDFGGALHDSMTWYYRTLGQFVRPIGAPRVDKEGRPVKTFEAAANTAKARLSGPAYQPTNLQAYLTAGGKTVNV
jgi:uncharacterized protein (DUF2235 family)